MGWFPLLVLIVFGMVSIAYMMQMPKEKPMHNIKRVIRGVGADPVVEPVVDVKHPSVEPVGVVEPEPVVEPVSTVLRPLTPPIKLEKSDDRYQQLKYITDAFKEHNVVYYLDAGSILGAVRIGGVMNHDKDIDIATLDANEEDIEEALNDAKVQWEFQNSGTGPGNSGFGYKVTLKNTKTYIDIWLMSISGPNVVCVGRQNGCKRWLNKYHVNPEQLTQKTDVILPLRELRFGTEMLMFPNKVIDYLNKRYPNWKTKCGGWQRGTRKCQPSENEYFRNNYEGNLELLGAKADKRKTVGIVTVMTKQNKWCECGTQTMKNYAITHGYTYYLITKENHFLKHVKFQKYAAVLDNMKHDIMVLMDCDIAITNPQIKVEEIFEEYNNDIIIARDAIWKKDVPINSGVIIFKNSQFSKGVLEKMKYSSKSTSNKYLGKVLVDQPVLTHLLVEKGIKEHPSTAFEKTNHVTIVPQRVMNAFHRRGVSFFKNDPEDSRWRKGDWLAHVTGSPARIRTQIMKELGACKDKNTLIHDNHEKTTLVLMGFSPKRIPNYEILFKSYGSMTNVLDKIIFIWNNQDVDPPKIPSTDVSIKIWKSQVNSMVNRYRVYDYVDTVSVLTVDDDVLLSGLLIKDMIKTFYMDQSALIGLDERSFTKNKYSFRKTNANKLVIGKTMMWNKKYTKEFLLDNALVSFSEENPCEDIAMNFLIRHNTGKEPKIIKMTYEKFRKNLNETDGLSIDPTTDWQAERNICIAFMQSHFYPKKITFLGSTWCLPPYYGKNCMYESKEECTKTSDKCFYNPIYGVAHVSCERWFGAQKTEQVTWDTRKTDVDRNDAHAKSFNFYSNLPKHLGHVVELGSGPFTQSKTILKDHTADSITLVEPMALHYMNTVEHCYYKKGRFGTLPTTLMSIPAEKIPDNMQFDTVIMINVIEHVYDAFSILKKAVELVKPGGYFVWHERLWNKYEGKASSTNDREFHLHPIRLKQAVAETIIKLFDTLFVSYDTDELRRLKTDGIYFIGKKRPGPIPDTFLPIHTECINSGHIGSKIILYDLNKIEYFYGSTKVAEIVLIIDDHNDDRLQLEKYKSKLKTVISGQKPEFDCIEYDGSIKENSVICIPPHKTEIFSLLQELNNVISKYATEKQVYGNVFSGNAHDQVISYSKHVQDYVRDYGVDHICEIGFAGGHSATTLLLATEGSGASYTAFDIWDRKFYENTALKWLKEKFPLRNIHIIKGDSTITVPNSEPLQCDIIHIDGAHHAHYPKTDYINMQKHASANNLLLIDDCTDSWKAVMEGVKFATDNNIFQERPKQFIPKAWSHRGKKKGWCIGSYSV